MTAVKRGVTMRADFPERDFAFMSSSDAEAMRKGGPSLENALALMKTALGMLDEARAPGHIGAHLDLAICQLAEIIDQRSLPESEIRRNIE